ncbi:hypothetical protein EDB19DRAFT_1056289 [Suillus lakei]|nr:hypothetical protein EDB19DRAFT_1056289 [Suillus lakei]
MLRGVSTSSGTQMNSRQGFLMTRKPMLNPPQHLVPVLIFLHSLVAFLCSFPALDPMKRSKLGNLQRRRIHMRFSIACLHSFALPRTLMKVPNFRNPQCFCDCVHGYSSVTCPHSCPAPAPTPMKQLNPSDPKRPQDHVQVRSSTTCLHSSALHPMWMKQSNSSNGQGKLPPLIVVLMLSKSLHNEISRHYMLLADRKQLVKRRNASRIPNRGFVWCCFFAVSLPVPMTLIAAHRQLFSLWYA